MDVRNQVDMERRPLINAKRIESCELPRQRFTHHHVVVFLLTFVSFAVVHASRKAFSNVKPLFVKEWTSTNLSDALLDYETWNSHGLFNNQADAELFLGVLDTVFMFAYAVGLFISGSIGDRVDMRILLSVGMFLTSLTTLAFGKLTECLHFYNKGFYITIWILNGLAQSTGWPTVVSIMGQWFDKSSRGVVLGSWASCSSVGNILGSYAVAAVLKYGYDWAFTIPASVLISGSIIVLFGLVPNPCDIGLPPPSEEIHEKKQSASLLCRPNLDNCNDEVLPQDELERSEVQLPQTEEAIGFVHAILLPGVLIYSLSCACLKFVNYSLFFWLPLYLTNNFAWNNETASRISVWNDVGSIIGGTVAGIVSDKLHTRSPVVMAFLLASIPTLFTYGASPNDMVINAVLMTLVGAFTGGAAGLIGTTITADLGRQEELIGKRSALATVTGIIDGIGCLGAALGQIIVSVTEVTFGWNSVFYLLMIATFLSCVCLSPVFIKDMKEIYIRFRRPAGCLPIDTTYSACNSAET